MMQFTLDLIKDSSRPIIQLDNLTALLDTGADIPVWTDDEEILVQDLGARLIKRNLSFKGFGGLVAGNVYELPVLRIGKLSFTYMHIITCKNLKDAPYQLIISASMFHDLIYEINDKTHRLNITVPEGEDAVRHLRIIDVNGNPHVLCTGAEIVVAGEQDIREL